MVVRDRANAFPQRRQREVFAETRCIQFARPPQGAFTHAAVADYDRDGHLDIYFCLYNYYQGLDQYRYPVPYFDARNGPPNYIFHNEGTEFSRPDGSCRA